MSSQSSSRLPPTPPMLFIVAPGCGPPPALFPGRMGRMAVTPEALSTRAGVACARRGPRQQMSPRARSRTR
eukprot:1966767-Pyramimonas_sp.AAC.1